jgi:hypothetical protein
MALLSAVAGPKCENYFHAAESGRRCYVTRDNDEVEGRYQCAVLAPYEVGQWDCRMLCFLRHRGLSPVPVLVADGPIDATFPKSI